MSFLPLPETFTYSISNPAEWVQSIEAQAASGAEYTVERENGGLWIKVRPSESQSPLTKIKHWLTPKLYVGERERVRSAEENQDVGLQKFFRGSRAYGGVKGLKLQCEATIGAEPERRVNSFFAAIILPAVAVAFLSKFESLPVWLAPVVSLLAALSAMVFPIVVMSGLGLYFYAQFVHDNQVKRFVNLLDGAFGSGPEKK